MRNIFQHTLSNAAARRDPAVIAAMKAITDRNYNELPECISISPVNFLQDVLDETL
jgi:hypothetical protein